MSAPLAFLVGLICGVVSGFGVGGGTLLILYLTLIENVSQRDAQGLNLLYFLPTALAAILLHSKNRLVEWRAVLTAAPCGCIFAALSAWLCAKLHGIWLQRGFGLFLIVIALHELRWKPKHR